MGAYDPRIKKEIVKREIHPVWRGIGCLLMVLIPMIAIAAADVIINSNLDVIAIPMALRSNFDTRVFGIIYFFPAKLLLATVISVALFAVVSVLYSILYRMMGQNLRGPMDSAPVRKRVKKRDL